MPAHPQRSLSIAMTSAAHSFHAVAFVENLALRELAPAFPEAKRTAHELWYTTPAGGTVFVYPFGAMVFHDVPPAERESQAARLHAARPGLTNALGFEESFSVREDPGARTDVQDGVLIVDKLSFEGASVVAMTVASIAWRRRAGLHSRPNPCTGSSARRSVRATRSSPSCTCSTSRTRSGRTRPPTASTTSCRRSSICPTATRRSS